MNTTDPLPHLTVERAVAERHQAEVEALARSSDAVKDFVFLWRRYRMWPTEPPFIALDGAGGRLLGFHAARFGRLHVNSFYQLVAAEARGRGVGGAMVDALLAEAIRRGCSRLKFKVHPGNDGHAFWSGFGLRPFATDADETHLLFDISLSGVERASDLARVRHEAPPESVLRRYRGALKLIAREPSQ